ncbi:MAG: hypothetical protein HGA45_08465 [Chloroflexales bacterium]|nr:hypothetical protein [Chloroflexales bacterium]
MLSSAQRERILCHLRRGWKLPDSLVHDLWTAYETLEQALNDQDLEPSSSSDHSHLTDRQVSRQHNPGAYDVDY